MTDKVQSEGLHARFGGEWSAGRISTTMVVITAGMVLVLLPVDIISEVTLAVVGALMYASMLHKPKRKNAKVSTKTPEIPLQSGGTSNELSGPTSGGSQSRSGDELSLASHDSSKSSACLGIRTEAAKQFARKGEQHQHQQQQRLESVMPVAAITFKSEGWEAEVGEMLPQLMCGEEAEITVRRLLACARESMGKVLPDAEVDCFAFGSLQRGRAFAVAVPEVELVVTVEWQQISKVHRESGLGGAHAMEPRHLQKWALRACTDALVNKAGFKFRRSAFRNDEPKVTLLAPTSLSSSGDAIPLNLMVNAPTPCRSAVVLAESTLCEPRAKELVLLAQRWARDRGISMVSQGTLPPYAWSLLALYFMQVGLHDGPNVLPPQTEWASWKGVAKKCKTRGKAKADVSTAVLFRDFFRFYATEFSWQAEAVSVRLGQRAPPVRALERHYLLPDTEGACRTVPGPSIEDPYDPSRNLGRYLTSWGVTRLTEEFERAHRLCSNAASLSVLLEPWAPPEPESATCNGENKSDCTFVHRAVAGGECARVAEGVANQKPSMRLSKFAPKALAPSGLRPQRA